MTTSIFSKRSYGKAQRIRLLKDLNLFSEQVSEKSKVALKLKNYQIWARKYGRTSADTLVRCFGSWDNACTQVGKKSARGAKWTESELLELFMAIWAWNSDGTYDVKLQPTSGVMAPYAEHHGLRRVRQETFTRKGWKWSTLKNLMYKYSQGLVTIDEVMTSKELRPLRKAISPRIRAIILHRDKRTCQMCGSASPSVPLEIDHVIPVALGGSNHQENLRTLCINCNCGKSSQLLCQP